MWASVEISFLSTSFFLSLSRGKNNNRNSCIMALSDSRYSFQGFLSFFFPTSREKRSDNRLSLSVPLQRYAAPSIVMDTFVTSLCLCGSLTTLSSGGQFNSLASSLSLSLSGRFPSRIGHSDRTRPKQEKKAKWLRNVRNGEILFKDAKIIRYVVCPSEKPLLEKAIRPSPTNETPSAKKEGRKEKINVRS